MEEEGKGREEVEEEREEWKEGKTRKGKEDKEKEFGIGMVGKLLLLLCVLFYFAGFFSTSFLEYGFSMQVFAEPLLNTVVLVLGIFFLSIAFYGILAPVLFFLLGIEQAAALQENSLLAVKFVPFLLAGYAGILVGSFLKQDFKKPVQREWTGIAIKIVILIGIALVAAVLLEHFSAEIAALELNLFA